MKHSIKTKYDLNDPVLISLIDELPLWSAPFGLKLLDIINFKKNISVLDIGFGLGFPLLEAAMRLGDSCKVYGIDPWEAGIERVKFKIETYGINNVKLFNGGAEEIPLESSSIDLIISNNGINNVEDLDKVFQECGRVAKIGAQFVFTFNLEGTMIEFYDVLKEVLMERGLILEIEKMKQHIYKKRRPVKEVTSIVEKNGFKVKQILEDSFRFRYNDGTAMLNHFFIKLAFIDSWKELIPELRQDEIFNEVERVLNVIAGREGEIKLSIPYAVVECFKV